MDLGPSFNEALLPARQATSNQFDPINGDYRDVILAIGMKVGSVMLSERLYKHSDDNPKKAGDFWHPKFPLSQKYYHFLHVCCCRSPS
jgi:hypothetical protein